MKTAIYYDLITGEALQISSGPAGIEFAPPTEGCAVLVTDGHQRLPGYVAAGEYIPRPQSPGGGFEWDAVAKEYIEPEGALASSSKYAMDMIDAAAGRARLRYITDVPGQQATYTRKEQQARQWVDSGYAGPAPSFIAAEASALGETPQHIAQQVITLADYWAYVKGPEIEAARIKHKAAVRAAATLEAVQAALDAALEELEAL